MGDVFFEGARGVLLLRFLGQALDGALMVHHDQAQELVNERQLDVQRLINITA